MGNWRGRQGYTYSKQKTPWTKPHNRRPPQDSWQLSVPHWEKRFCWAVGSVPWGKLVETKTYMHLYDNIVHWNDSAGKEAFDNAKNRFWAEINGLSCSISLPDPDIYIDAVDWNSSIDPELILDLEREPKHSHDGTLDEVVIQGNPLILNQSFWCTGWGEDEEDFKNKGNFGWGEDEEDFKNKGNFGWGEDEEDFKNKGNPEKWDSGWNADSKENPWEPVSAQSKPSVGGWDNKENPWEPVFDQSKAGGGGWNDSWNSCDNNTSAWKNNMDYRRADGGGFWGKSDGNSRNWKKEGGSCYHSGYKTSRFHGGYYQKDGGWRS